MVKFSDWLDEQLEQRNWTRAELARHAGVNQSTISMAYSGQRNVGTDVAERIAKALGLPVQTVYRAAGLLPPEPEYVPLLDEWNAVFYELDDDERQELLDIARLKVSRHKSGKTPPKTSSRIKKTPARSANVQK